MSRKVIPKKVRLQVYEKFNGHCAYCGNKIEYKDMQIDHFKSVGKAKYFNEDVDNSLDNLMPACRMCNFYKGELHLKTFRTQVATLHERLEKLFIYRLAKKYGMLIEKPMQDEKFYFERV